MIFVEQIVNSVHFSNTYILYQKDFLDVWLIDIGDFNVVIDWIKEKQYNLKGVFITHTHYDHIYGLNELLREYPDLLVYTSLEGKESLYSDKLNLSRYHNNIFVYKGADVIVLSDGDEVDLGNKKMLNVYKTPGHDWSCLTYQIGSFLFTGDSYIPGLKVVVTFPKSNKMLAKESLDRILLIPFIRKIYAGHGDIFSIV